MSRPTTLVTCLVAIALAGLAYGLLRGRGANGPPPAPAQTGSSGGAIVGASTCKQCHREIAAAYDTSGHAHTFHSSANSDIARGLAETTFADPQRPGAFRYHLDAEGLTVSRPDQFGDERFPLTYALGSGTHAVTFLTLLPHKEGGSVGLEHRATWYKELQGLGLTVGHPFLPEPVEDAEHFGRVIDLKKLVECINCHTTQARIENNEVRHLIPHVGCESCHGPGGDHVAAQNSGLTGPDLSTARRWPTALDELRTCGTCHRLPETIKQSELNRGSRVLPRFQPAGLMQSRCFTESKGELRCTTCHDPHAKVSTDTLAYERICQECHQRHTVQNCPEGNTDCVGCHLPKVTFEGVAGFHDHWIRIRKEPVDPPPLLPASAPAPAQDEK
jgi:hypothetical protein